jgi:phospholipase C
VHRVADGATPFDRTSILATVEHRFGLAPLSRRAAAAPDVGGALRLTTPRTDDPLAGVSAPPAPPDPTGLAMQPAHLQQIQAELLAEQAGLRDAELAVLPSNADYQRNIASHS